MSERVRPTCLCDEVAGDNDGCRVHAPKPAKPAKPACGSGWTGDRCTKALGHRGSHSNE